TITVDTPAQPPITAPSSLCAGGSAMAGTFPGYSSYSWSIQWGAIDGPADQSSVSFHSVGTSPVQLMLAVTAPDGCSSNRTVAIPVTGTMPQIMVPSSICQGATANAQVTNVTTGITWSITNGVFQGRTDQPLVHFHATSAAPVTLTLTVVNGSCTVRLSRMIAVNTPPPPAINLDYSPVCPGGYDFATIGAPTTGSWQSIQWSIVN